MKKILITEDDKALNYALSFDLQKEGYKVTSFYKGEDAVKEVENHKYDLVILDINLPGFDGYEIIKQIKSIDKNIPVLFLSAYDLDENILKGFDLGAEDYITKPFNVNILHKKIDVILRRFNDDTLKYDDGYLSVDLLNYDVSINKKNIYLTPTEHKLLSYLIENKNQIISKDSLINHLWDNNNKFIDEHTLLVNISRLRAKIEDEYHKYIKTVYGIGYKWMSYE